MKLLLHICCAPCSTEVIERLSSTHDVTGFFYNPNIYPRREYESRLLELERFSKDRGFPLIIGRYDMEKWFTKTKGFKKEPEGGKRCEVCFKIRMKQTAKTAKKKEFKAFTTTLSISPHKDAEMINSIGRRLQNKFDIDFLAENFKKKDGFKKSVESSKQRGMHRQNYCGCVYSKLENKHKQSNKK
jgi:predicted adenine nucleotide alpha hydrolase (AANH) superfamily ATPase